MQFVDHTFKVDQSKLFDEGLVFLRGKKLGKAISDHLGGWKVANVEVGDLYDLTELALADVNVAQTGVELRGFGGQNSQRL